MDKLFSGEPPLGTQIVKPFPDRPDLTRVFFPNGFGASILEGELAYGGELELAVVTGTPENSKLNCDTPITDDVLGWLKPEDIEPLLLQISELPAVK